MQSGCKGEVMVKNGTDQIYGWAFPMRGGFFVGYKLKFLPL